MLIKKAFLKATRSQAKIDNHSLKLDILVLQISSLYCNLCGDGRNKLEYKCNDLKFLTEMSRISARARSSTALMSWFMKINRPNYPFNMNRCAEIRKRENSNNSII